MKPCLEKNKPWTKCQKFRDKKFPEEHQWFYFEGLLCSDTQSRVASRRFLQAPKHCHHISSACFCIKENQTFEQGTRMLWMKNRQDLLQQALSQCRHQWPSAKGWRTASLNSWALLASTLLCARRCFFFFCYATVQCDGATVPEFWSGLALQYSHCNWKHWKIIR